MKFNFKSAVVAAMSFGAIAVAYLLERSTCLSLPGWAMPVLTTAGLTLNALLSVVKAEPSS